MKDILLINNHLQYYLFSAVAGKLLIFGHFSERNMSSSAEKKIAFVTGCILMIYLMFRAFFVPFVHDESATFFFYIHTGNFLPWKGGLDANNHFLNSALSYFFYRIFGSGELSLRSANLIFFPVFYYFWFRLSELLSNRFIRWTFFFAGVLAHSFIEFFALSRGYGMSMALLTMAVWFLINVFREHRPAHIMMVVLCLFLMLYANLALLNTAVLIICCLVFYLLLNQRIRGANSGWVLLAIVLCIEGVGLCAFRLFQMKQGGTLYYGSDVGFWWVTMRSLMHMLLGTSSKAGAVIILAMVGASITGCMYLLFKVKERLNLFFSPAFVFSFLLLGNIVVILLLNKFLKVNYPEDRVGMYLLPFFIGCVCFVTDAVLKQFPFRRFQYIVFPLLFFPIHFFWNINFSHSSLWSFENIPHRFYDKVSVYIKKNEAPPTMAGYRMRELPWAYQNFRQGGEAGIIAFTGFPETISDFQVAVSSQLGNWNKYYERVDYDKASDLSLLKRKTFLTRKQIFVNDSVSTKKESSNEFFDVYKGKADTLAGKDIYVNLTGSLQTPVKPFVSWLVISISDKEGKEIRYERVPFDWIKTKWKGDLINMGIQIHAIPSGAQTIICYIWNMNKVPYTFVNGACRIFELEK